MVFKSNEEFDELQLSESKNITTYLDSTRIHPEHYSIAKEIIKKQIEKGTTTFGKLKEALEGLNPKAINKSLNNNEVDITSIISFIIEELKEPCKNELSVTKKPSEYAFHALYNDPTGRIFKVGNYIPVKCININKENKSISASYNGIKMEICDLEEKDFDETFIVGNNYLARIDNINTDTYAIECKVTTEPDLDKIKELNVVEALRDSFIIEKESDLFGFFEKASEKKDDSNNEPKDVEMTEEIDH